MNKNCDDENGCTEKLEFSLCSWCFPKPVSLHNVYISYGHNFSIGSDIGIMYWNFNLHKTVHLKTQKSDHFYWITCRYSKLRHWLQYQPLHKDFCPPPPEFLRSVNAFSEKPEQYEILFMSKTLFQVEFSVLMLLLWLVRMQFLFQNQYIHTNRDNKQQK